tara:strand:+ start:262 stop:564 length:303 start_codon:yes stop_codon:yes gene_type:complete
MAEEKKKKNRFRKAGETFEGYNKPKKTPGGSKKFAVLVKDGDKEVIVRFGDPNMQHYKEGSKGKGGHGDSKRRANFKSRHNCDDKKDKTKPGYWSCNWSW